MYKRLILTILCITAFMFADASSKVSIIPLPQTIEQSEGEFVLTPSTRIVVNNKKLMRTAELLQEHIYHTYGYSLAIKSSGKNAIRLVLNESKAAESYELKVEKNGIQLIGSEAGVFYASQSLLQMIEKKEDAKLHISCVNIQDEPRFGYRGLLLDVARYFYPVDYIKKFLDLMAYYKFNVFHWHLTEDAGWRIEIKKYPELTTKGAWRNSTQQLDRQNRIPHGGFYTQEQAKEIVRYAAERQITVIPEVEMPGHAMAALSVYPDLSCTGGPFEIPLYWGIKEEIFCAGNEKTFEFLEDVLSEIIEIFPSKYIHIGGDEALKRRWKECPKCQDRIKAENLRDEHELQSYFIQRIEKFLNSKGKQIIGWDEILEGGVAPNATVMSWRGEAGGIAAASQQHDVIMVPNNFLYLDYYQSHDRENEPMGAHWFPHPVTVWDVYNYEPYTPKIAPENQKHVIGVQANVWMEMVHSIEHLEYMLLPRMLALAEVAWTPIGTKNYDAFIERLSVQLAELDRQGILFRIPEPYGWNEVKVENGQAVIDLKSPVDRAVILYTTDGSDPLVFGKVYTETIKLPLSFSGLKVKCVVRLPSGRPSNVYTLKN